MAALLLVLFPVLLMYNSRLAFVEQHFGKGGLQRVLQSLAPDDQRPLKMLFTSNWYPFELGRRLDGGSTRPLSPCSAAERPSSSSAWAPHRRTGT